MRELPILFSTPMVQAIQENRKTMTRRTAGLKEVNENPNDYYLQSLVLHATGEFTFAPITPNEIPLRDRIITCNPRYQEGDKLWVKETYCIINENPLIRIFKANVESISEKPKCGWKPSLFMRKEYARIWLECTGVRCERLHWMKEEDARLEGMLFDGNKYFNYLTELYQCVNPLTSFYSLWIKINGKESLELNPWVFVYEFKRIEKTEIKWKHFSYEYNYKAAGHNGIYIGATKTTMQDEAEIIEHERVSFKLWCLENKVTPIDYKVTFEK